MILATWLSQAANEEQTSVISAALKVQRYAVTHFLDILSEVKLCSDVLGIFQVLCHLPLNKALPAHMSAILQGVNKLRFYRIPGVCMLASFFF